MEGYFIGSGAILEAGERSKIIGASLHAQFAGIETPDVALVDFEGASFSEVRQLLAVVRGYSAASFDASVTACLMKQGECAFDDIVRVIAESTGAASIHLYAHWEPPRETIANLQAAGVILCTHPLEDVSRAALIARHRYQAWQGGLKAA